jgi:peroxiredoxin
MSTNERDNLANLPTAASKAGTAQQGVGRSAVDVKQQQQEQQQQSEAQSQAQSQIEGKVVPDIGKLDVIRCVNGEWKSFEEPCSSIFGKKLVVVAVPGAFTPVCSEQSVPHLLEKLRDLKTTGVSAAILAVNDKHVMKAWAQSLPIPNDAESLCLIADGDSKLSKALGISKIIPGHGERCNRAVVLVSAAQGAGSTGSSCGTVKKVLQESDPNDYQQTSIDKVMQQINSI